MIFVWINRASKKKNKYHYVDYHAVLRGDMAQQRVGPPLSEGEIGQPGDPLGRIRPHTYIAHLLFATTR